MLLGLVAQALAEDKSPTTPEAVWAEFDPRKEPLEIDVTKRWSEHGSIFTEFTFTGMSHKPGDPKWRGPENAKLQFQVHVRAPRTLRVVMHEKEFAIGWTQYSAEVALEPGEGWTTITLPCYVFSTDKGEHLKG